MGLDDLQGMDKPDNVGGRPPKEEQEDEYGRSLPGDPLIMDKDDEEWWEEVIDEVVEDGQGIEDAIPEISNYIYVNPIEVRKMLEDHGFIENDWDEYIESRREKMGNDHLLDSRIPGYGGSSSATKRKSGGKDPDWLEEIQENRSSEESSNTTPDSGLGSLLNDATNGS